MSIIQVIVLKVIIGSLCFLWFVGWKNYVVSLESKDQNVLIAEREGYSKLRVFAELVFYLTSPTVFLICIIYSFLHLLLS